MEVTGATGKITLLPRQIKHYEFVKNLLLAFHFYMDTSECGSGKTFILLALALFFGFGIIVICPKGIKSMWAREAAKYGVYVYNIISYASLRSVEGCQPKHGYLNRCDTYCGGIHKVEFIPTQNLLDVIERGVLVVFDEVDVIRNANDQNKACNAICSAIIRSNRSRFAFLSGTPIDREENAINFERLIGFIRSENLYTLCSGIPQLYGAAELINVCKQYNSIAVERIIRENPLVVHASSGDIYRVTDEKIRHLCYRLFIDVIKPRFISSMPPPSCPADIKNGYYYIAPEIGVELTSWIEKLHRSARYDASTGTVNYRGEKAMRQITKALVMIEFYKLTIFARLVRRDLYYHPNDKIIVYLNYVKDSLLPLSTMLADLKPMLLYGPTDQNDRDRIIEAFQGDNSNNLLICNMETGGRGINLQDLHGSRRRRVYFSPNYKPITTHQAIRRVVREGSKSMPIIRGVYADITQRETSILAALSKKGDRLAEVLSTDSEPSIILPGQYQSIFERLDPDV